MPSLIQLTAALALAGTALSNPVRLNKRDGFTVQQVASGSYLKNGPAEKVKALRKFGKSVPQNLLDAAATRADQASAGVSGSDPANPSDQYDDSYLCPVSVGGTTLSLDFDTGSSDLWVFSSLQGSSELSGHNYYHVNPSKLESGETWSISYGDGSSAAGNVYADKVVVGGVTATSQAVEAATSVSSEFTQDTGTDGLLGLAFSSINTVTPDQQTTFFDTVKSQLAQPLFAADLKYHAAGTYDFGFIDKSKYTGSITYVDIDNSQGFWAFSGTASDGTAVNGIFDTGTTLIYVDDNIVSDYYANVDGATNDSSAGGYTFPCSTKLPDWTINIGGVDQTVPGQYINFSPVSTGSSTCFGGIQSDDGIGQSILGDVFLKSKYVIFENSGSPRVGLANQ